MSDGDNLIIKPTPCVSMTPSIKSIQSGSGGLMPLESANIKLIPALL